MCIVLIASIFVYIYVYNFNITIEYNALILAMQESLKNIFYANKIVHNIT